MEQKLIAERRPVSGKEVAKKVRAAGQVPAVLYGHGMDPVSIAVNARELTHLLHRGGANVLIDLEIDGKPQLALAREIQRDHIKGQYVHVDFIAVRRDERITVAVPVRPTGEAPGVKAGGVLEHHLWEVQVECLARSVPEAIDVDISELNVGDSLRVADLVLPEDMTLVSTEDELVLAVVVPQARAVEELPAEAAEGEVPAEAAEGAPAEAAEEGGEG